MKFVKVLFGNKSYAGNKVTEFKINDITVADPLENPDGFHFSNEENIARWLIRGDTIYDVIIPDNANVIKVSNSSTPDGVYTTDKIVLTNPRTITDEIAFRLYQKSNFPENTYFKTIAGYAVRGHVNAAKHIIKDKINAHNIDLCLSEFQGSCPPNVPQGSHESWNEILNILNDIKQKSLYKHMPL